MCVEKRGVLKGSVNEDEELIEYFSEPCADGNYHKIYVSVARYLSNFICVTFSFTLVNDGPHCKACYSKGKLNRKHMLISLAQLGFYVRKYSCVDCFSPVVIRYEYLKHCEECYERLLCSKRILQIYFKIKKYFCCCIVTDDKKILRHYMVKHPNEVLRETKKKK